MAKQKSKTTKPTVNVMSAKELFNVEDNCELENMAKRKKVEGRNFETIRVVTDFYRKILRDNNIDDQRAKRYLKKFSTPPFFMTSDKNVGRNGI